MASSRSKRGWVFLVFPCVISAGCSSIRHIERRGAESDYCAPAQPVRYEAWRTEALARPFEVSEGLRRRFTRQDLLLAHVAGVMGALEALERTGEGPDTLARRDVLLGEVELRLLLFSTALSSVAAELDCEVKRTGQVASLLGGMESRNQTLLTVSSIVVGSLATIATAISNDDTANDIIDITGGAASAGLGIAALVFSPSIQFDHPRNLLADVWRQPVHSEDFPPALWYVLRHKDFSNEQRHSIAHNVRSRWIAFGYVEADGAGPFFGAGGRYDHDALRTRTNMLGELQAAVRLIDQNLLALLTKVATTWGQPSGERLP
ncbi:hypothetical protein LZ198_03815 [Myxococcus sp. K15C18031901]|uniref:hypothetical protein n=1 Tax=Myxococcus dinghuensis TaxID=2906761 RepID=UPI0020A76E7D|nr:hypothetical protein [Myxococcus dinghuensis]MCP3098000.1 hypothetical protein [Myxococcus dinghuensis]